MYSKMLRQFSKGSLISISSESSKIHLLIKVLCRPIWFNLCRRYFLFHILSVSLCYQQQRNFIMPDYLVFRYEIFQLSQCYYNFVRAHSHIESSHSFGENDAKLQTDPSSTLYVKISNLPKIDVHNFWYKISVGILMKLFFLSHQWINKCINQCKNKYIREQYQVLILHPCRFFFPLW